MATPSWYPSYPLPDGTDWMHRLLALEQSVQSLSDRIGRLEQQVEEVRSRPPMHVEYHFDQLKVSELKGTLNVGLSPQGVQGIDAFETPPVSWQSVPGADEFESVPSIGTLQQQMLNYMDLDAPAVLMDLEREYGITLGDEHRSLVLRDVKRQLKERVHYYAKTAPYPANGTEEERRKWSETVIDKTTKDVGAAFRAYLAGLKSSSSDGGGETK